MLLGEIPFKSKEKIIENQLHFKVRMIEIKLS